MFTVLLVWAIVTADASPDYGGIAAVITAIGVLVAALAAGYVSIANTRRIKNTEGLVKKIDRIVNGQSPTTTNDTQPKTET